MAGIPDLQREQLACLILVLEAITDPKERFAAVNAAINFRRDNSELAELKRQAVEEMHDSGLNYTEIAAELGIKKSTVSDIRRGRV